MDDNHYNVGLPEWWIRLAWLCRGLLGGFAVGLLVAYWMPSQVRLQVVLPLIIAILFFLALTFLPKAWIEQRNRMRAAKTKDLA
jgi:hypothetical protein